MRRFVKQSKSWLAERHAGTETVASTVVGDRAVLELLAHLNDCDPGAEGFRPRDF